MQGRLRFSRAPIWGGGALTAAPGDGARLRHRRRRRPLARAARRHDARRRGARTPASRCSAAAPASTPGC
ncbi:MAG: hypothetical protein MZW92_42000 [Comamonadaceae bacterium]|nr:hypothetical protein [Comamonadaceae bacterium]